MTRLNTAETATIQTIFSVQHRKREVILDPTEVELESDHVKGGLTLEGAGDDALFHIKARRPKLKRRLDTTSKVHSIRSEEGPESGRPPVRHQQQAMGPKLLEVMDGGYDVAGRREAVVA